jgi:hypothetical protein
MKKSELPSFTNLGLGRRISVTATLYVRKSVYLFVSGNLCDAIWVLRDETCNQCWFVLLNLCGDIGTFSWHLCEVLNLVLESRVSRVLFLVTYLATTLCLTSAKDADGRHHAPKSDFKRCRQRWLHSCDACCREWTHFFRAPIASSIHDAVLARGTRRRGSCGRTCQARGLIRRRRSSCTA